MLKPNRNKKMMEAINAPTDTTLMRIRHKVDCHRIGDMFRIPEKNKEVKKKKMSVKDVFRANRLSNVLMAKRLSNNEVSKLPTTSPKRTPKRVQKPMMVYQKKEVLGVNEK